MYKIILSFALCIAAIGVSAQEVTYVYDDLGRVQSVTYSDGTSVTFTYDPAGNRIAQMASGFGDLGGSALIVFPLNGFTVIPISNGVIGQ